MLTNPLFINNDVPKIPARIAWLSLVGNPKNRENTAKITTDNIIEKTDNKYASLPIPCDERFMIFSDTFPLNNPTVNEPRKSATAEIINAFLTGKIPVETQAATEFGASVQPFTNATDKTIKNVK